VSFKPTEDGFTGHLASLTTFVGLDVKVDKEIEEKKIEEKKVFNSLIRTSSWTQQMKHHDGILKAHKHIWGELELANKAHHATTELKMPMQDTPATLDMNVKTFKLVCPVWRIWRGYTQYQKRIMWQASVLRRYYIQCGASRGIEVDGSEHPMRMRYFLMQKLFLVLRDEVKRRKHIEAKFHEFFQGDQVAMRVGKKVAYQRRQHLRLSWNEWNRDRVTSLRRALFKEPMQAYPRLDTGMVGGHISFFRQVQNLFHTKISSIAANVLEKLCKLFVEANTCRYAKYKGDGSLELMESCVFIRKMMGQQFVKSLKLEAFAARLKPILQQWDLDSNGTLEFHEICVMVMTDQNFNLDLPNDVQTELLAFMSAETPQLVRCRLRRASMVDTEKFAAYANFMPDCLNDEQILGNIMRKHGKSIAQHKRSKAGISSPVSKMRGGIRLSEISETEVHDV